MRAGKWTRGRDAQDCEFLRTRPYEVVLAHMKRHRRRCKRYVEQHVSYVFPGPLVPDGRRSVFNKRRLSQAHNIASLEMLGARWPGGSQTRMFLQRHRRSHCSRGGAKEGHAQRDRTTWVSDADKTDADDPDGFSTLFGPGMAGHHRLRICKSCPDTLTFGHNED